MNLQFYNGKKVLVTGHTGFKGTWLCKILLGAGADVLGYSRGSHKDPSLFELSGIEGALTHVCGDIRNYEFLEEAFRAFKPEIVFHLAAQPLVRESYAEPRYTYDVNLMGTVNVLECIRATPSVKSVVIVTTDKVYHNNEWAWGYRENEPLDGFDPYSNSKSCAELAVHSYRSSFLDGAGVPVSTARAGNVLGGGDFAKDRIMPDCVRAASKGVPIVVRNPNSVRPFQHVLEPLFAYLMIAKKQHGRRDLATSYNIGPDDADCVTTGQLVSLFCEKWGEGASWIAQAEENAPHEAGVLRLDCSLMKATFGWRPRWHIDRCVEEVCRFSKIWLAGGDVAAEMDDEIARYIAG